MPSTTSRIERIVESKSADVRWLNECDFSQHDHHGITTMRPRLKPFRKERRNSGEIVVSADLRKSTYLLPATFLTAHWLIGTQEVKLDMRQEQRPSSRYNRWQKPAARTTSGTAKKACKKQERMPRMIQVEHVESRSQKALVSTRGTLKGKTALFDSSSCGAEDSL